MTDRDVVDRVGRLFGRAVFEIPPRTPSYKTPFGTAIKGSAAVELMTAVRPHLGAARHTQIDAAISSWCGRTRRIAAPGSSCAAEGCSRPTTVRGLCRAHYKSWWKAVRFGRTPRVEPIDHAGLFPAPDPSACVLACQVTWLAGLLEGEGFFGAGGSPDHAYPIISVQMCDAQVVSKAAAILGAPSVRARQPRDPRWRMTYVATLVGADAAKWMERLGPLMGARRRVAIEAALRNYRPTRLVDAPDRCVVAGCTQPHRARGLCHKHYMSWLRDVAKGRMPRVASLR